MDISLALKTGYFQALTHEIGIPIYDAFAIPATAVYPYVIISNISVSERIPNGCKIYNATVTLDIVTGFSSPTGMSSAWNISELITDIINPMNLQDLDIEGNGWVIGETRLSGSNPIQLRTGNYWIYRNLLVFNHIVYSI
jgi:hypothetical protein